MHYVDTGGAGETIVMVHGNPEWSFSFRHLIRAMQDRYRCVAPDHLGFGLSDKPADAAYLPVDHAQRLERLIGDLALKNITLVVNDWGGPIGLSYAINHPDNVKRLVIMNTWLWPVDHDLYYRVFSGLTGSAPGQWLIRRYNLFMRLIVPLVIGQRQKFPPEVRRHYWQPLTAPADRIAHAILPGQIAGASTWLQSLWTKRAMIRDKPTLVCWGMRDLGFRERELKVWERLLTHKTVVRLPSVGHFPHEEAADQLVTALRHLMTCPSSQTSLRGKQ